MRRAALFLSLLAVTTAAVAQSASAAPPPVDVKAFLALSESQIQQLHQLQVALREQVRPVAQLQAESRRAMDKELNSAAPNPALLGQLTLQIHMYGKQIEEIRKSNRTQAIAVLNAEQRARLDPLRLALVLQFAAHQAVSLNLIGPHERPGEGQKTAGFSAEND